MNYESQMIYLSKEDYFYKYCFSDYVEVVSIKEGQAFQVTSRSDTDWTIKGLHSSIEHTLPIEQFFDYFMPVESTFYLDGDPKVGEIYKCMEAVPTINVVTYDAKVIKISVNNEFKLIAIRYIHYSNDDVDTYYDIGLTAGSRIVVSIDDYTFRTHFKECTEVTTEDQNTSADVDEELSREKVLKQVKEYAEHAADKYAFSSDDSRDVDRYIEDIKKLDYVVDAYRDPDDSKMITIKCRPAECIVFSTPQGREQQ